MSGFLAVLVVGVGTYLSRAVFIVALAKRTIPERVVKALDQVGPATLAALIVTMMTSVDGELQAGLPELGGLAAAAVVGLRWRNLMLILVVGMGTFWLLRALTG